MADFESGYWGFWGPNGPKIQADDVYTTSDGEQVEVPAGTEVEFITPTQNTDVHPFEVQPEVETQPQVEIQPQGGTE